MLKNILKSITAAWHSLRKKKDPYAVNPALPVFQWKVEVLMYPLSKQQAKHQATYVCILQHNDFSNAFYGKLMPELEKMYGGRYLYVPKKVSLIDQAKQQKK